MEACRGFWRFRLSYRTNQSGHSLDRLALVETFGIGAPAVKRSGLGSGEKVLVFGAGPIGVAVTQFRSSSTKCLGGSMDSPKRLA